MCGQANATGTRDSKSFMDAKHHPNLGSGKVSNPLLNSTNTQYAVHTSIMKCFNLPDGWFLKAHDPAP